MKKATLLFVCVLTLSCHQIYALSLSDSSRITLLTCAPGEDLYSAFGHTGIRVTDYKQQFDIVFNYGTFDFNQPNFYLNFVRGKMRYMLSVENFRDFMQEYIEETRSVSEQDLNLTVEDRKKVFDFLYTNALPENCQYYYDFFWDNCATRPRDVFEKVLGSRLQYHTDTASFEKDATLHDMLRLYTRYKRPWVDFGFDLALGLPCDIHATPRMQTFLPDYLAKYEACATVDGKPFVTQSRLIIDAPPVKMGTVIDPLEAAFFLLLFTGLITYWERSAKRHNYVFDFILFFIAGLAGCALLSLWLFTVHYSTPKNLNLIWLIPTHVVVAFFLLKKQKPLWLKSYFRAAWILTLILSCAVYIWIPHYYNGSVVVLVLLLVIRAQAICKDLKKTSET